MKKIIYIITLMGVMFSYTSCEDFLKQDSPSDIGIDDVLSDPTASLALLDGAFETWRDSRIHSNGLFYSLSVCSSDAERHPEKYADQERHIPENLYYGGPENWANLDYGDPAWERGNSVVGICNQLIDSYESGDLYDEWMATQEPTELSNIYGMAVALRATIYYELTRHYGDIQHQTTITETDSLISCRDYIWEYQIDKLQSVVNLMYRPGENGTPKTRMTRTYAEGLIGRLCLLAGGYSTRRTDLGTDFYHDIDGNTIQFETKSGISEYSSAIYNRRTDYLKFYQIAKKYLVDLISNPGTAELITSDPRSTGDNGEAFGNPFQYKFQQMLDLNISTESIYEIAEVQGSYSERPYAFGRPSGGGGSNAFPCKSYGQSRMHPTYYYSDFDPKDLRRDVTVAVTASVGNGRETLLSLEPGNKTNGGLANNKWDENRMSPPWYAAQRQSGVNHNYMHMSDVILNLAEVYAVLGEEGNAKNELTKVRSRAFVSADQTEKVTNYINALSGGSGMENNQLLDAILTERKLELAGEGLRKWDMIRNGKFPEMITELKAILAAMINGIESDGYYTFDNGNEIPAYVWTKQVDAKDMYGYRLTTQCPDESDPTLFPGWRGQYNDWENVAGPGIGARYNGNYTTNTAIKGLFKHITPESAEATDLEADGYEMQKWGEWLVEYKEEYSDYVYRGFEAGKTPIYLIPINTLTIQLSQGKITNGYGFPEPQTY